MDSLGGAGADAHGLGELPRIVENVMESSLPWVPWMIWEFDGYFSGIKMNEMGKMRTFRG